MARIVNNRICFPDHNVVFDEQSYREFGPNVGMAHMIDTANILKHDASAGVHEEFLMALNIGPKWSIERPTITFKPMHSGKERDYIMPDRKD